MYQFHDYFDLDKAGQPYASAGEELEDYLHLLDMMLESYLESKGMGSQQKLFSRGLVITESEMNGYFEMPPFFRERDIWNPVLAASADAAFTYIEERSTLMAEQKNFRKDLPSANFDSDRLSRMVNAQIYPRIGLVFICASCCK